MLHNKVEVTPTLYKSRLDKEVKEITQSSLKDLRLKYTYLIQKTLSRKVNSYPESAASPGTEKSLSKCLEEREL